jgi:hypothetical protein
VIPYSEDMKLHIAKNTKKYSKSVKDIKMVIKEPKYEYKPQRQQRDRGIDALAEILELSEKHKCRGPKDLAINMDDYLYGKKSRFNRQ